VLSLIVQPVNGPALTRTRPGLAPGPGPAGGGGVSGQ
jgi:hypothetical protein